MSGKCRQFLEVTFPEFHVPKTEVKFLPSKSTEGNIFQTIFRNLDSHSPIVLFISRYYESFAHVVMTDIIGSAKLTIQHYKTNLNSICRQGELIFSEEFHFEKIFPNKVTFGDVPYDDSDMIQIEVDWRYNEVTYKCWPEKSE